MKIVPLTETQKAACEALSAFGDSGPRPGNWYERRAETMRRAYMHGMTLRDIGAYVGLSQERASIIIKKHMGFCPECGQSLHG